MAKKQVKIPAPEHHALRILSAHRSDPSMEHTTAEVLQTALRKEFKQLNLEYPKAQTKKVLF